MKSKQTMFFTTLNDIKEIMKTTEELFSLKYYKKGLLDSPTFPKYDSILDVPDLGNPKFGDWNYNDIYLVIPKYLDLNIQEIPQRKGGTKYTIDPPINPTSILINIGGIYSENIIVAGKVGTVSNDDFSITLYKTISSKIKKQFKQIDGFYVGNEAMEKLKEGWRLVTNEKLDKGFDLRIK